MRIVWSPEAVADLRALRDYISESNPAAAKALALRIIGDVESLLQTFPDSGRPGRVEGTREIVISRSPFIAVYRRTEDALDVIRIFHAARKWPVSF